MRRRLVVAFVALTLAVTGVFAVLRGITVSGLVRQQEQDQLDRASSLLAAMVADVEGDGEDVTAATLAPMVQDGERLSYLPASGGAAITVPAGSAVGADDIVSRATVPGEGAGGTLTLSLSGGVVANEVRRTLLPLALLGVVLVLLAAAAAVWLAGRLARPLRELADSAAHLGTGRPDIPLPSTRIPEAVAIAESMRSSAARIDRMLRHEQELARHASHELRTPLTALRVNLEDLALWPQTDPRVRAELEHMVAEVDRLAGAVGELLESTRRERDTDAEDVDLAALVLSAIAGADHRGPTVVVGDPACGPMRTHLPPDELREVVTGVLAAAAACAVGAVEVGCVDHHTHLELVARFEGPLGHEPAAPQLRHVSEAAQSIGGRISLGPPSGATYVSLLLPRADSDVSG